MKQFIKILTIGTLITVLFILLISIFAFTTPTKTTVTFHSNDLNQITRIITDYSKIGYSVKFIEAQSVSTSITTNSSPLMSLTS